MKLLKRLKHRIFEDFCKLLTLVSPRLNTIVRYRERFGKNPDLINPKTLNEKILKLKLERYPQDKLVRQCADKYAVREYVKEKGLESILIPLIVYYDNIDEVEWDKLPNSFVMKWNFGSGYNLLCPNKNKLDIESSVKIMKKWGNAKFHLNYSELHYKGVTKKIIVEEFLRSNNGFVPEDYKIYCFHGDPKYIMLCEGREPGKKPKFYFFDTKWNFVKLSPDSKKAPDNFSYPNPKCLDYLLECARRLSSPFEFVRADFFIVNDRVYFGELTFTPAAGLSINILPEVDLMFGELVNI